MSKLLIGILKGAHIFTSNSSPSLKQKVSDWCSKIKTAWKSNSKFTIHPFRSLHSHLLLPLSIKDYAARFGLEIVVLTLAVVAIITNVSLKTHANLFATSDQSVIFSFLKSNPSLNGPLFAQNSTTTIVAHDQLVSESLSGLGPILAIASNQKTDSVNPTTIQDNVIVKTNPSDSQALLRAGRTTYTVSPGDSVTTIAASFGISPTTVMLENKLDENSVLKPGQQLTILPTTGISYTLTSKDTLESITKKFKISEEDFLDANDVESFEDLSPGDAVVIPQDSVSLPAKPKPASKFTRDESNKVALKQAQAPDGFSGGINFIWPTTVRTITQGFSRRHPGLDISDSKMEPIFASEDGFVEVSGYQTNGYGNTIVINHGNGFKTRYGHASVLYVSAGEYVTRGQLIGKQGRTGRVRGATGIHVHFEIIKDGVKVNPLAYVRP